MNYEQYGSGPWLVKSFDANELTGQYRFATETEAREWMGNYGGCETLKGPRYSPKSFAPLSDMGAGLSGA